jgi:serine/threonine-protein kinase
VKAAVGKDVITVANPGVPVIPMIDGVNYTVVSDSDTKFELGRGGGGEVWRVRSSADAALYALKRIRKATGSGSERKNERFRREIGFGLTADHPHVIRVHAQTEDARYFYYAMDLYPWSLRDVIADESDDEILLEYLSQLCEAIVYVHGAGIVHRDIKPENVLVDTERRRLVLADFGIAHFKNSALTTRRELLANRNYQAPEQMLQEGTVGIDQAADVFALGLIITAALTKQNARGSRHLRVGEVFPYLAEVDALVERMTLQDATQRPSVVAVYDTLRVIRRQTRTRLEEIADSLAPEPDYPGRSSALLSRAAKDVLSGASIFERAAEYELPRYNSNFHCEISYRAVPALYNACVQAQWYAMCKAKFEYESYSMWGDYDLKSVVGDHKAKLLLEFEALLRSHPVDDRIVGRDLPTLSAHYFRFCKDYHAEELLRSARDLIATAGTGSLRDDLLDAPILWIARSVRHYLASEPGAQTEVLRREIGFDQLIAVDWTSIDLENAERLALGANLLEVSRDVEGAARVLDALARGWDVSWAERGDGNYAVHFRSGREFARFRTHARGIAQPYYVLEGDVIDLLRPEAEHDDLVALIWEPFFEISVVLAKVLGLSEIRENSRT